MKYYNTIKLKNGKELVLRNGTEADGAAVHEVFNRAHGETDYLLSYPDENTFDAAGEARFLKAREESSDAAEILAVVDGVIVGTAGIEPLGTKFKVKHRSDFGISVLQEYWGLGIGTALTEAGIECAREAGYKQLELTAVADNVRALALYKKAGYVEFGRNPKGFLSRYGGWQELVYMRLEL